MKPVKRLPRTALTFPLVVALVLVIGLAGGIALGSTFLGWPDEGTFQVAVNQEGNMRLLGPDIKGKHNTELKENEFLIEVPSRRLVAMLENRLIELENRVTVLEDLLSNFTITATAGVGGSISPFGAVTVDYGADQTFIITPDSGYHIADVLVDGLSVGTVSTYTFSAVAADHTIEVSFAIDSGVPEGTVLWLPMDEGEGSVVRDKSGFGNDGIITGATWGRIADGPWYLSFDGTDDYVDFGDPANGSFDLVTSWTIITWLKPTLGDYGEIIAKRNGATANWYVEIAPAGEVWTGYYRSGWRNVGTTTRLTNGVWALVASTWNGTYLNIYINGRLEATSNNFSSFPPSANNVNAYIGRQEEGTYFEGLIGLPRILNRSFNAVEVQNLFDQEKHLFGL